MKRLQLLISGKVQGRGYRWFVRLAAEEAGASGWVRNEVDGTVTAEVQATDEALQLLIKQLQAGNGAARVQAIAAVSIPVEEQEAGFEIRT